MKRDELIDAVLAEMDRVWGEDGFGGEPEAYAWLLETYSITEEEDVSWQLILEYSMDDLPEDELDDDELMAFLEDDGAVERFLEVFLEKYRSSLDDYPQHG